MRDLVWSRMRAFGLTLSDLSRHVGRNDAYIHQYLFKGSPKRLPELVRGQLASLLEVPEAALRGDPAPGPAGTPIQKRPLLARAPHAANDIPVFAEDDVIDPAQAAEWMPGLALPGPSGGLFAVWIGTDRERLKAGDLAIARAGQPARTGDLAVGIAHGRVVHIGEVKPEPAKPRSQGGQHELADIAPSDFRFCKVIAILLD